MKSYFRQHPYWLICLIAVIVVTGYWSFWASDRYVSQSNVVLESPQIAPPVLSFSSILSGGGGGNGDMLLLRDYLLSVDMLLTLDQELGFRQHYANNEHDIISRLWSAEVPLEELHAYYLKQVSVELDEYAQVLRIKVSAYEPQAAYEMVSMLLRKGEAHMNDMGQRLAAEQVRFLEKQVSELSDNFHRSRMDLIDYQNKKGMISPTGTVESLSAVVASLESELASMRAKRKALISYQSAESPEVRKINREIKALNEQIEQEMARMAQQSGGALNVLSSEYQTLELKAQFAQDSYSGALAALENTRIEAARKLKQVSILQSPTLPEYSVEPKRLYNVAVFAVMAVFLTLITQMLVLIIQDHKD